MCWEYTAWAPYTDLGNLNLKGCVHSPHLLLIYPQSFAHLGQQAMLPRWKIGQSMAILNTHKAASDLLNHRSQIYSGRPRLIMSGEILAGGMIMPFMTHTDQWRRMRRATHEGLNIRASEKYRSLQEVEAARLATNLLHDPDNWDVHFKRSAASSILCSVYGWDPIEPKDDPLVERINSLAHRLASAALPGAYLVDIFPLMKHLPSWMAKWKREGLEWFAKDSKMFEGFLSDVKERTQTGNCRPCFTSSVLENPNKLSLTNEEASWLAGTMFTAGSETSAGATYVFLLAMVLYPDVMRTAQAEINEVVGRDRLPNFGDYDKLPYISAMVKEVLRWRPVLPLDAQWRVIGMKDTIYQKAHWLWPTFGKRAMNRGPALYPDYDEFHPSRFLDASGKVDQIFSETLSMGHVIYGFGKRICPGMHVANQSLFINIARILWALDIEQATDSQGNQIIPSRSDCIDGGAVVRPAPFTWKITARSSDAVAALEHARADEAI